MYNWIYVVSSLCKFPTDKCSRMHITTTTTTLSSDDSDYENTIPGDQKPLENNGDSSSQNFMSMSLPIAQCEQLRLRSSNSIISADNNNNIMQSIGPGRRWSSHSTQSMGALLENGNRHGHHQHRQGCRLPQKILQNRAYRIINEDESQFLLKLETKRQLLQMEASTCSLQQQQQPRNNSFSSLLLKRRRPSRKFSECELSSSVHLTPSSPSPIDHLLSNLFAMDLPGSMNATIVNSPTASQQHHQHRQFTTGGVDDSTEMRLSFASSSSSTGYSSARSSLRGGSSDPGDESGISADFSVERSLLLQEASLSEQRRLELLESSTVSQLDRIAMELLETERGYVNDLHDIVQGYLSYLIDHRDELRMTVEDVSQMFGCIERILGFNQRLYRALDATQLDVAQMAQCFIDKIDGFNDYIVYCTQYQKMDTRLRQLMQIACFSDAMQSRQKILGHALPLASYLLKPNMIKAATSSSAPVRAEDRIVDAVQRAERCMAALAERINEAKRKTEHLERVEQLQTVLASWNADGANDDLQQYGDLLLEATFKLVGTKTARRLFLFEEALLIVKERGEKQLVCKDFIMCSSLMVNESIAGNPLGFQVVSFDSPRASNMEQKREWTRELKRAMLDHYAVQIPEKAKALMLDINRQNASPAGHHLNGTGNHGKDATPKDASRSASLFPKYLERRRRSLDATNVADMKEKAAAAADRIKKRSVCISEIGEPMSSTSSSSQQQQCTCEQNQAMRQARNREQLIDQSNGDRRASTKSTTSNGGSGGGLFTRRKTAASDSSRQKMLDKRKKNSPTEPRDNRSRLWNNGNNTENPQCTCNSKHLPRSRSSHPMDDIVVQTPTNCKQAKSRLRRFATENDHVNLFDESILVDPEHASEIERTFADLYHQLMLDGRRMSRESSRRDRWNEARKVKFDCRGSNGAGGHRVQLNTVFPEECSSSSKQEVRHNRSKSLNRLDNSLMLKTAIDDVDSSHYRTPHQLPTGAVRFRNTPPQHFDDDEFVRGPRLDRNSYGYQSSHRRDHAAFDEADPRILSDYRRQTSSSFAGQHRSRAPLTEQQQMAFDRTYCGPAEEFQAPNPTLPTIGIVRCMVRQMEDGK